MYVTLGHSKRLKCAYMICSYTHENVTSFLTWKEVSFLSSRRLNYRCAASGAVRLEERMAAISLDVALYLMRFLIVDLL